MGRGRQKPERRNGTLLVSRMGTLLVSSKPILFSQSYALEKRLSRLLGTRRDLARTAACPVRNPGLKTPSINTDAVDWFHCKKALLDVSAGRNNGSLEHDEEEHPRCRLVSLQRGVVGVSTAVTATTSTTRRKHLTDPRTPPAQHTGRLLERSQGRPPSWSTSSTTRTQTSTPERQYRSGRVVVLLM